MVRCDPRFLQEYHSRAVILIAVQEHRSTGLSAGAFLGHALVLLIWSPADSAVPECRKPRHSTGVPKPDLAPVQTAAGLGMTPGGMCPRSGGAAGLPPQNAQNRRVLGTPGLGMTTKGRWPKAGGSGPTTGGIRGETGSTARRSCARVICNVIWKVNGGQYD